MQQGTLNIVEHKCAEICGVILGFFFVKSTISPTSTN